MRNYIIALIVLAIVLLGEIFGVSENLFITVPFYDVFMHLLGGLGIGFFLLALFNTFDPDAKQVHRDVIIGVLIIGVIWEIFEIKYDLTGSPPWTLPYYLDTIKDLINDILGAIIGLYFIKRDPNLKLYSDNEQQ